MKETHQVEYRGFGFGQVFIAAVDGTRDGVARVPEALRKATEAARDAFIGTLAQQEAAA